MTRSGTGWSPPGLAGWLACLLLPLACVHATAGEAGHGSFSVSYQVIHTDGFEATTGKLDVGTTDTRVVNLTARYHLTDRWTTTLGIPLIRKRYQGGVPHDPRLLSPPRDAPFIDDGNYHTSWQDWFFKAGYLAHTGPLQIEPFLAVGVPSQDYPFFAASAVGQNQTKVELGVDFLYTPGLSDAWYRLELGYVFVEEVLDVSTDHWRLDVELGYFFSPRWSARVFLLLKEGDGLNFPDDFPLPRTGEQWYQHDRMVKHNYLNLGLGADWAINDRYSLSMSALKTINGDQIFPVEYAFTLGLTRSF